jgi:hypothetical protein
VMAFTIDEATVALSTGVVHAASEYVVIRIQKVPTEVGLVTLLNVTAVVVALGAEASPDFTIRKEPAVALFAVQPEASPSPTGWLSDDVFTNPVGVVQAPDAVVQAWAENDWMTVAVVATLKLKM